MSEIRQPTANLQADPVCDWSQLSPDEQTELLVAYGYHADSLPRTCSLTRKEAVFSQWLSERGIRYCPNTE